VLSIVSAGPASAKTAAIETITAAPKAAPTTEAAGVHHRSVGEADRGDHQKCFRYQTYRTALGDGAIHGFASSAFVNAICLASLGSCGWKRLDAMSFGNFQPDKIAMYSGEPGSLRWLITILRGSGFLAPVGLIHSASLLGRECTGISLIELILLPALAHLASPLFPTAFVCLRLRPTSAADLSVAQLSAAFQIP
jgi:hypothetical protein